MMLSNLRSLPFVSLLVLLLVACASEPTAPPPTPTPTPVPTETSTPEPSASGSEGITETRSIAIPGADYATQVADLATVVAGQIVQRTPVPTPTPTIIDRVAEDVVSVTGLSEVTFLGLTAEDWIDIFISIIILGLTLLILTPLLLRALNWVANRTRTEFDNELLIQIKRELGWLLSMVVGRFIVLRLDFLGEQLERIVQDVFFLLITLLAALVGLRLVRFSLDWFLQHRVPQENRKRLRSLFLFIRWFGYLVIVLFALAAVASQFGIDVAYLAPSFLIVVLIVAIIGIAAKSAIADTIAGFLILIDQPFRSGDDIYISDVGTTGEVKAIGFRSTRLLTPDNRSVIVPNSIIGASQVINYTLPNPTYRVQVDFLTVGGGFEELRLLIEETVRGVEGVLPDKPVDVIYLSFGGTGREIRLLWWIESASSQFTVQTKVFIALEEALANAGVETPNLTYNLKLQQDSE